MGPTQLGLSTNYCGCWLSPRVAKPIVRRLALPARWVLGSQRRLYAGQPGCLLVVYASNQADRLVAGVTNALAGVLGCRGRCGLQRVALCGSKQQLWCAYHSQVGLVVLPVALPLRLAAFMAGRGGVYGASWWGSYMYIYVYIVCA